MDVKVDVVYLIFASFAVIGLIEWAKSLVEAVVGLVKEGKWKPLAWVLGSLAFSVMVAAFGDGGKYQVLTNAVLILAFNEILGYNVIVKGIFAVVDFTIKRLSGSADPAKASPEVKT